MDNKRKEDILKKIAECENEDFDGHTDFSKMSAVDKLLWLSNTIYFIYIVAKENPDIECASFFK